MAEIYTEAGRILTAMETRSMGLRAALYEGGRGDKHNPLIPKVCALVCRTLEHKRELEGLLLSTGLLREASCAKGQEPGLSGEGDDDIRFLEKHRGLVFAMAFDFLFGRKKILGGGRCKRLVVERLQALRRDLLARGVAAAAERGGRSKRARSEGESASAADGEAPDARRRKGKKQRRERDADDASVALDPLLPCCGLRVAAASSRLLLHSAFVREGLVAMQDRASSLAAIAAEVTPGDVVLDACAAPGSKTLHVLDRLRGRGRLVALERDRTRAAALLRRLLRQGGLDGPFTDARCLPRSRLSASASAPSPDSSKKGMRARDADGGDCEATRGVGEGGTRVYEAYAQYATRRPLYFTRASAATSAEESTSPDSSGASTPRPSSSPSPSAPAPGADGLPALLVEVRVVDFLSISGALPPFCFVQKMLLDPSCSGSGLPLHLSHSQIDLPSSSSVSSASRVSSSSSSAASRTSRAPAQASSRPADLAASASPASLGFCALPPLDALSRLSPPPWHLSRVRQLASFQRRLLTHALTQFPRLTVCCYSTCSSYVEENEAVVDYALASLRGDQESREKRAHADDAEAGGAWRLRRGREVDTRWFPSPELLKRMTQKLRQEVERGGDEAPDAARDDAPRIQQTRSSSEGGAQPAKEIETWREALQTFGPCCIRSSPGTHCCRGFFLARLERAPPAASESELWQEGSNGNSEGKERRVLGLQADSAKQRDGEPAGRRGWRQSEARHDATGAGAAATAPPAARKDTNPAKKTSRSRAAFQKGKLKKGLIIH
ncbi:hypothetical protein BESB_003340 [Besnoitia besnoiti]|uniref:SAM-dependent methyltransferase RsmB-F/NOP2-type catalytic core domain-containing protein n=1 Tax=Besnoitia besnoiti TaxID=94643 RepID=A0A2A9MPJ8_BESBE|nr:hypothetical protein BESB_003340 [Besnoitia besnoiti]PFH37993.1 hypothetical protein BESB_003340 [Besnoitia besnoiti]